MRLSCSVCLEEATEDSQLVALTVCGHTFDAECISQCMLINDKCPLCNQSTIDSDPVYSRVYFSAFDGDGQNDLMAVKEELTAAKDSIDTLSREYDDLALRCTVVEGKLNTASREKMQLEKDSTLKDAQIDKLSHNWQTSKARNKDDVDKMNLKLIAKQKSIDLLTKNLDKSNKRIKSLKEELDALKHANIQDCVPPPKARYRDQNFKAKYYDLNKEHKALKDKMGQLENKLIDLTLTLPEPSSSILPSKTEALQPHIQLLEEQVQASMAKEKKLLKEVMTFKQLKEDAVKKTEELQTKLSNAEATIASWEHSTKKDDPSHRDDKCNIA
ncbi:hypothetical protein MAM1_0083d04623 [Mucor ambiguus]|uniref:RING-type domain-containing protein n=1 Tax=Mucor ambiguus TaxID=91626 RepID=A0A0C9MCQ8_9FUNG|nr:hypothetical protein MAM1_0083d04623 [Mucor ambiguus]